MGDKWLKKALGVSEAQRQLSRQIGVPISKEGRRRKYRGFFSVGCGKEKQAAGKPVGVVATLAVLVVGLIGLVLLVCLAIYVLGVLLGGGHREASSPSKWQGIDSGVHLSEGGVEEFFREPAAAMVAAEEKRDETVDSKNETGVADERPVEDKSESSPAKGNGAAVVGGGGSGKTVHVKGYTNKNGKYVAPYDRAAPGHGTKRK